MPAGEAQSPSIMLTSPSMKGGKSRTTTPKATPTKPTGPPKSPTPTRSKTTPSVKASPSTPAKSVASSKRPASLANGETPLRPLSLMPGMAEEDESFSMWDGDDMTLDMVTDVNDRDVDEEVRVTSHLYWVPVDARIDGNRTAGSADPPRAQASALQAATGARTSFDCSAAARSAS